jgi:hypothetical protein
MDKRGPQIGMALQQRLRSHPKRLRIQLPFQTEHDLYGVEIRSLRIVKGMEQ